MKKCQICYETIPPEENVEWLMEKPNYKYILGKYVWYPCPYCFNCLQISRKLSWRFYLSNLFETNCVNTFINTIKYGIPIRITDNMKLDGIPIKALYYKGEMHSSKLITGMNDFQFYNFQNTIRSILNEYNTKNDNNIKKMENLQNILQKLSIL